MLIFGHGGGEAPFALNALGSFSHARAEGADGVELDVRLTVDGRLIAHHDPALPDGRLVSETESSAIPAEIPSLESVLEVCEGLVVNIEIKNYESDVSFDPLERVTDAVIALLDSRGPSTHALISSFGPACLGRVRALRPELATAALLFVSRTPGAKLEPIAVAGHTAVHPFEPTVTGAFVRRAHELGLAVNVWFNDDEQRERVAELAEFGVDGFITSQTRMVREVVEGRKSP